MARLSETNAEELKESLKGAGINFVVYVPERKFFANPFGIGDTVLATWLINVARVLR